MDDCDGGHLALKRYSLDASAPGGLREDGTGQMCMWDTVKLQQDALVAQIEWFRERIASAEARPTRAEKKALRGG